MIAIASTQPESAASEIESSSAIENRDSSEVTSLENDVIAGLLEQIAGLLAHQGAVEYRVHAYQKAADFLRRLDTPVRQIDEREGIVGLIALPTIGQSIASLIEHYLRSRRIPLLDRLSGEDHAEHLFATLPGLGPELSRRIHDHLDIETLPELYAAVRDGRLERVPGVGKKRVRAIGECLAERIRREPSSIAQPPRTRQTDRSVSVAELLEVDEEYRRLAAQNRLPKIAPRKFNPGSVAWLPILHTQRDERHYTVLFSNTARAHELNTTRDWVIIYRDDPDSHARWTVVTAHYGKLHGCRIVRGREGECKRHYLHDVRAKVPPRPRTTHAT